MWATPTSHARVGYSSPRSGSDPNWLAVTRPSKTRSNAWFFLYSKKISSTPRLNSINHGARACRVVSRREETRRASEEEEEEERACGTSLLTHLPTGATPHLICWSTSLPTSHVELNLAPTTCLCAAKNLGCMLHGLTHMRFEILGIFEIYYGPILNGPIFQRELHPR
jgi:hypothetical protein